MKTTAKADTSNNCSTSRNQISALLDLLSDSAASEHHQEVDRTGSLPDSNADQSATSMSYNTRSSHRTVQYEVQESSSSSRLVRREEDIFLLSILEECLRILDDDDDDDEEDESEQ